MISAVARTYSEQLSPSRCASAPWIKDGYEWFRQEKARMVHAAFWNVFLNKIEGDFLEFGVFEGVTFIEASYAARGLEMHQMRFHAFDSFTGLPALEGPDVDGPHYERMCWASRKTFDRNLKLHQVNPWQVTVTEGLFDDTLTPAGREQLGLSRAAIVWIDCDLYASTVPVLRYITDILVDGAILVFDDWFTFKGHPDRGEQLACRQWLEENPQLTLVDFQTMHATGKSFIVHRRD